MFRLTRRRILASPLIWLIMLQMQKFSLDWYDFTTEGCWNNSSCIGSSSNLKNRVLKNLPRPPPLRWEKDDISEDILIFVRTALSSNVVRGPKPLTKTAQVRSPHVSIGGWLQRRISSPIQPPIQLSSQREAPSPAFKDAVPAVKWLRFFGECWMKGRCNRPFGIQRPVSSMSS